MISFQRVPLEDVKRENAGVCDEINVFQTVPWLDLLTETQKAEPVIAAARSDGRLLGYFTGLIVNKYGVKVLGSPFRGWGTYFMGFSLMPDVSRREALQALPAFAFKELGCHYLEVVDPCLCASDWEGLPYQVEDLNWFALNLTPSEEKLFADMKSSCRNCIRKSVRSGVVIEEATDIEFADEYYAQFKDVMEKHGGEPTYGIEYLRRMIKRLLPTGNLLLLRARESGGRCIATGIFLALNRTAVFWGAASWREHQSLRPNELLAWYGIENMKARGVEELHLGAGGEQYKRKFGCYEASLVRLKKARYAVLEHLLAAVTSPTSNRYKNWMLRKL